MALGQLIISELSHHLSASYCIDGMRRNFCRGKFYLGHSRVLRVKFSCVTGKDKDDQMQFIKFFMFITQDFGLQ